MLYVIMQCRKGKKLFTRSLVNATKQVEVTKTLDGKEVIEIEKQTYQALSEWQCREYPSISLAKKANGRGSYKVEEGMPLPV